MLVILPPLNGPTSLAQFYLDTQMQTEVFVCNSHCVLGFGEDVASDLQLLLGRKSRLVDKCTYTVSDDNEHTGKVLRETQDLKSAMSGDIREGVSQDDH